MATDIMKRTSGRAQYLSFILSGVKVQAARYRLSRTQFCPWLVTEGADVLPANGKSRGWYLSKLFAA